MRSVGQAHWAGGPAIKYDTQSRQPRIVGIVYSWATYKDEVFSFQTSIGSYTEWIVEIRNLRYSKPPKSLQGVKGGVCTKIVGFDWLDQPVTEPC